MVDVLIGLVFVAGNEMILSNMYGMIVDVWCFYPGSLCFLIWYWFYIRSGRFFSWCYEVSYFDIVEGLRIGICVIEIGISRCMSQVGIHQPLFSSYYARCIDFSK